ncbi:discoidin domain-containing protein [Paenibacillus koleovorans]|uniref:discoidin domain-containing protein n=1 Tax=Paenibacillus koleovorans TaxID=121608 RepID=UPI000FD936A6|nr:discoidin domain-containing protein [Paenibacillus koleovorans]
MSIQWGMVRKSFKTLVLGIVALAGMGLASGTATAAETVNLSIQPDVTVTADSEYNSTYTAAKAIDGNTTGSNSRWLSMDVPGDHWLQIEFGRTQLFNSINLYFFQGASTLYYLEDYKLQYYNGSSWVDIVSVTGNTVQDPVYTFDTISAKKVRLYITDPNTNNNDNVARLYEMKVNYKPVDGTETKITQGNAYANFTTFGTSPENPSGTKLAYTLFPTAPTTNGKIYNAEIWISNTDGSEAYKLTDVSNIQAHNGARFDWVDDDTIVYWDNYETKVRDLDGTLRYTKFGYPGEKVYGSKVIVYQSLYEQNLTRLGTPTITADSEYDSTYTADKAFDNDEVTPESMWMSADTVGDHWLEIDFGTSRAFNKASLYFFESTNQLYLEDYKLQYYNGSTWVDLVTVTDNTEKDPVYTFSEVSAQKVRLYITDPNTNNSDHIARLYEMKIHSSVNGIHVLDTDNGNYTQVADQYSFESFAGDLGTADPPSEWKIAHPRFNDNGTKIAMTINNSDSNGAYLFSFDAADGANIVLFGLRVLHWLWYDNDSFVGQDVSVSGSQKYYTKRWATDGTLIEHIAGKGNHSAFYGTMYASESATNSNPIVLKWYNFGNKDGYTIFSSEYASAIWSNGGPHVNPAFSRDGTRLYYTKPIGPNLVGGYSYTFEPEVRLSTLPGVTATASSENNSSSRAPKAIDGDTTTNSSRWVSANVSGDHWLEIDFGTARAFNKVKLYFFENANQLFLEDYKLQYYNGSSWTDIVTVTDNTLKNPVYTFNKVTASKVRLYITDPNTNNNDNIARLYEMEVYGWE